MIKILFFIENLSGGGAEKVLLNLVNGMDKQKFDITVQTLYPDPASKKLNNAIKYKFCYKTSSAANKMRMRLETEAGLTYKLHIKDDYDIEIAYLECGATKIMAGSTNKNAAKLAWVHCDLSKKTDNPILFAKETAKYYKKFDKIVCVSEDVRNSFDEMYKNAFETVTVYNCYDDKEIIAKAYESVNLPFTEDCPLLLAVGRLSEEKCYDRLLKVQKRLTDEGTVFNLLILGEGSQRAKLEKYISENSLEKHVSLPGFCENPYPYIKRADMLVCSSRNEGYSTFAVEGMILGKPMITTKCSGMRELFGNGEYGIITENSENGLYNGIRNALTDNYLLDEIRKNLKNINAFSLEKSVKKTEEFLIDCIK